MGMPAPMPFSAEAFRPISVLCLARSAEEVLDHLEARPSAALGFKCVCRVFQALGGVSREGGVVRRGP